MIYKKAVAGQQWYGAPRTGKGVHLCKRDRAACQPPLLQRRVRQRGLGLGARGAPVECRCPFREPHARQLLQAAADKATKN